MFNQDQHEAFTIVSAVFNSLSFCSCLWLFYLYFKSPSPYSAQFRMLINLTISDFVIAITGFANLLSYKTDQTCVGLVFFSVVGYWSSAYWSSIVAIFSYKKIVKADEFNSNRFYNRSIFFWALLCIVAPLTPAFGILGAQYTAKDEFCSISFATSPFILFLITEGIPLMTAILVTTISYIKQIQALKNLPEMVLTMINVKASKLSWYPIAQCLVFIPGLLCQLVYVFFPYESIFFNSIRFYGFRLAGFVNSLVYGFQRVKLGKSQPYLFGATTRTESLLVSDSGSLYEEFEESAKEAGTDEENLFH